MEAPRAILFDLDGTLLDTAPEMVGALNAMRQENGLSSLPYDDVRCVVSHGSGRLVQLGFPEADAGDLGALQTRFLQLYRASLGAHTHLFAGMDRVLVELAGRGIVRAIVTNKPAWLTDPLLEKLRLTSSFACVVSGDTLSERKPHPLPLLHAAKLSGVAASECVYVGDAQRDVQAAHAAGMPALVATYGYLQSGEDWQAWGGDGFIRAPEELLEWLDQRIDVP